MSSIKRSISGFLVAVLFASLLSVVAARPTSAQSVHPNAQPVAAQVQASGCGFFTKAKIVLHIGVAYFAFKHWLYNPYRAGKFKKGASGRKVTILKAVAAALVGIHELHVALNQAKNCGAGAKMQSLLNAITGKANFLHKNAGSASDAAVGASVNGMSGAWNQINSLKKGL